MRLDQCIIPYFRTAVGLKRSVSAKRVHGIVLTRVGNHGKEEVCEREAALCEATNKRYETPSQ